MADPFTTTIEKLRGTGFFEFLLPFMLTAAIFYGLLRKSKIFGEPEKNVAVNGIVALTAAFMVWSYPVLAGVSFVDKFPVFFTQAMSAMLVMMVGLLITSMFVPPDLPEKITKMLDKRLWIVLVLGILIGGGILISSGLINLFFPTGPTFGGVSEDVIMTVSVVILFFVTILIMAWSGGGGK